MSWRPNAEAATFLARDVLPVVRQYIPNTRLRIVGRDPARDVRELSVLDGVDVTGRVDEVLPYLMEAQILAVPLVAGGGTRLKILEAFAAGLPVVSTPVGCEGIDALANRHLVVTTRNQFAPEIVALLLDGNRSFALASEARSLVRARYDWAAIGRQAVSSIRAAHRARHLRKAAAWH
jgi:glycosyltransferase involved in cell wall biosynthesis